MTEPAKKGIDDGLADGCLTPGDGWKYDPTVNGGKTTKPAKKMLINPLKKHLRACVRARALGHYGTRALGLLGLWDLGTWKHLEAIRSNWEAIGSTRHVTTWA